MLVPTAIATTMPIYYTEKTFVSILATKLYFTNTLTSCKDTNPRRKSSPFEVESDFTLKFEDKVKSEHCESSVVDQAFQMDQVFYSELGVLDGQVFYGGLYVTARLCVLNGLQVPDVRCVVCWARQTKDVFFVIQSTNFALK